MGSFRKLLWDQPIRGVLRRPSDPARLIGNLKIDMDGFRVYQDLRSEDTSLIVERPANAPLGESWRIGEWFDTNSKMQYESAQQNRRNAGERRLAG
jgi:hypothetical protein